MDQNIMPRDYADSVPVYCAHDAVVNTEKLVPNPGNPNTHPDSQISALAKIIKSQGWRMPITVSKRSGFIVKGHGRLLAALKAGLNKVPVEYQDYATEAEEYADLVADNRIAELAELDDEALAEILESIDDSDLSLELSGYTKDELESLQEAISSALDDIEEDIPEDEETERIFSRPHDLWILGRHRLLVGDSTNADDVKHLTEDSVMDLAVTDPPYGIAYEGRNEKKMTIANDDLEDEKFRTFLELAFDNLSASLKAGGGGTTYGLPQKTTSFLRKHCEKAG